jgi:hypothetical protein
LGARAEVKNGLWISFLLINGRFFSIFQPKTGLPDGLFSSQKSKFGQILEGLAMKDVGIVYIWTLGPYYGLLLYFMDILYSLY